MVSVTGLGMLSIEWFDVLTLCTNQPNPCYATPSLNLHGYSLLFEMLLTVL